MEKSKKFLTAAIALFAACLIAFAAAVCLPAIARAEETSDLALVRNTDGAATLDYTVGSADEWIRISTAQNAGTANMSAYGGLVFDVETDSQSFASGEKTIYPTLSIAIREGNDGGKEYRLNGNQAFGIYVYTDGETKTNSSLGIGANNMPSKFKGTVAVPWAAFMKGSDTALTADKLGNAGLLFIIEHATYSSGAKITVSNIRAVSNTTTEATVVSVNNTFGYIAGVTLDDTNATTLKERFADAKDKYNGMTDANKAKVTNADKVETIEKKFAAYEVETKIAACPTSVTAENYESIDKTNYASAKQAVAAAKAAYAALDATAQAKVTNADKIEETEAAIAAYEVNAIEDFTLVNSATGESVMDYTIPVAGAGWLRISMGQGQRTMDLSAAGGLAFDIETDSTGKAGFTLFFDEDGDSGKRYGGYGNKSFGLFVFEDGVCKTNSALAIGANLIPAGFKGTIFIPWEAFEITVDKGLPTQHVEYASAEKASNVGIVIYVDNNMFGEGTKLKISNFRAVKNPTSAATIASVNNTFAYAAATEITADNYASIKANFASAKTKYDGMTDENKAKVTSATEISAIEAKLETYEIGVVIGKIDACLTEIDADSYDNAKTLYADAVKSYNSLSDDSRESVTNAARLTQAKTAIETYEASLTDAKLDNLPGEVNSGNLEEAKAALEAAKAEYDDLDDDVKNKVTKSAKLAELEDKIDAYEAGRVDALIAALTDKIDKNNYEQAKKDYIAAQKAYGKLSANGKTKVTDSAKFAAVKAAIEKYENTDPVNVAAIILIAAGALIAIGGAVTFVLIKSKAKKRG